MNLQSKLESVINLIRRKSRKIWLSEEYDILVKKVQSDFEFRSAHIFKCGAEKDISNVVKQFGKHFGRNPEKHLESRLISGEIMLLGFAEPDSNAICFLSWLSESESFFLEVKEKWKLKNAICSFRTLVPNEYRRKGVGKEGISFAEKTAFDKGYSEIYGLVRNNNFASRKMLESRKWESKGKMKRMIILNKQYLKVSLMD